MYFLLCLGLITIASCYYDVEAELYGSEVCDNSNVLYTSRIAPLMESKCLSCHDAASGSTVVLDSYNNVKNQSNEVDIMNLSPSDYTLMLTEFDLPYDVKDFDQLKSYLETEVK